MKGKYLLVGFLFLMLVGFVSAGSCPNGKYNEDGSRCHDTSCWDMHSKVFITPFSEGWTKLDREKGSLDVQVKMTGLENFELKGLVFTFTDGSYMVDGLIKTEEWRKGDDDFDLVSGTVKIFKFEDYAGARMLEISPIVDLYGNETVCDSLSSINLPTFDDIDCIDTDGGKDYFTKGSTSGGKEQDLDNLMVKDDGSPILINSEDSCSNDGKVLEHYCTVKGAVKGEWVACPNGCSNGACVGAEEEVQTQTTTTNQTQTTTTNQTQTTHSTTENNSNSDDESDKTNQESPINTTCVGCFLKDNCYQIGHRKSGNYCSEEDFVEQKKGDENCENNFECVSNSCLDSKCIEAGFWTKFMNWFRNIFN